MKESYFMGIDTGTNSSKGVLINSHGEIIAEHTTEHAMTNPAPGHYEHDADKDWWGDLCIISNALIEKSKVSPSDIKAIGTSALGADCLPVDDQCRPLRKAILWMQIVADVTGKEISTPAITVGASFGDALMAASGIKYSGFESFNKLTDFIKPGKTYHPNKENHEAYKKYQNIYDSLYPATVNLMHCLSD